MPNTPLRFAPFWPGRWRNAETGYNIVLDEDYGKTFIVYRIDRHGWTQYLRGRDRIKRFRTFKGAVNAATDAAMRGAT
jgi:hypothetical protein